MSNKYPREVKQSRRPIARGNLLFFGLPVIYAILGNVLYYHMVLPAIPFLPMVGFVLYSVFMTVFAILFLLGLVVTVWGSLAGGWKNLARKDLRYELREKIRSWPSSKWDLLPVIATTYLIATVVPLVTIMLMLPPARLAGAVSQEEFLAIFLVVVIPILLIFLAMLTRWAFEAYGEMKQRWTFGTRRERAKIAFGISFGLVAWVILVFGDLAGWNDVLWFNSN